MATKSIRDQHMDAVMAGINDNSFANAYDAEKKKQMQQAAADAEIAKLVKGQELKQAAIAENMAAADQFAKDKGLQPGRYSVNVNEGGYGVNPEDDFSKMFLGAKIDEMKKVKEAQIPDFSLRDPSHSIPTAKDAEEVKASAARARKVNDLAQSLDSQYTDANALDRVSFKIPFTDVQIGTEKAKQIDADTHALLTELGRLFDLGALAKDDLKIVKAAAGDLTGIGSLFRDKEAIKKSLQEVVNRTNRGVKEGAMSRGYVANPGFLQEKTAPPKQETDLRQAAAQEFKRREEAAKQKKIPTGVR